MLPENAQNTPLRRDARLVKAPPDGSTAPARPPGFRRHFEGYDLGLTTALVVLTFALLALPRASVPDTLPLPRVDRSEACRSEAAERELAAHAEVDGLPFEVRAVGEAIRHFGRSSARGLDPSHDLEDIRARVKVVLDAGHGALLLRLRAVQTQYFLEAVRQFDDHAAPSADLEELGGGFLAQARKSAWLDPRGHLLADIATQRVLFQVRWADLIGKRGVFPFSPTLNEWRIYYRFLLLRPERDSALVDANADDSARLSVVSALARKDSEYPAYVAQGYLLYRIGDAQAAASAYRTQLALHPSGPYALLTRNYLIYALRGVSSE